MTIEISELPVGFDLLSDDETFLNELADEQEKIYGGYCAPTPYTPIVLCPTPPEPGPKPKPQPTPPIPAPWPKRTPPIQMTPPEIA